MATTTPKPAITVHPAAALFPMMSDDELQELGTSIEKHGLREKIHAIPTSTPEATHWEVVDGRNRLEAIRRYLKMSDQDIIAKFITPVSLTALHCTVEEYVMMANIERRNLTQAQRRDLAGKLAIMLEERQKNLPKEEQVDTLQLAADKAGVSRRTAATSKAQAKKPKVEPSKTQAKQEPPKYVPLKPINVKTFLENIVKTLSHEVERKEGDSTVYDSELAKWTLEECREAQERCKLALDILDRYIPIRAAAEEKVLQAKLRALQGGGQGGDPPVLPAA